MSETGRGEAPEVVPEFELASAVPGGKRRKIHLRYFEKEHPLLCYCDQARGELCGQTENVP
jgi:hypothetical protein